MTGIPLYPTVRLVHVSSAMIVNKPLVENEIHFQYSVYSRKFLYSQYEEFDGFQYN